MLLLCGVPDPRLLVLSGYSLSLEEFYPLQVGTALVFRDGDTEVYSLAAVVVFYTR